ncbi:MAG TPA: EAL domain-containing protein, partial [Nakamurella sp.]
NITLVMDPRELARASAMVNGLGLKDDGLSNLIISGRHRDGTSSWYEVSVVPQTDAAGELIGFQGTSRLIGPGAAKVVADRLTRRRIEDVLAGRLLMTAFQPIVDLRSGEVVGVEGLTRFIEEPGISPDLCFADATAVGLGTELELLAVQTALTAAASLPSTLSVSVNISPVSCLDARLAAMIIGGAIDPKRLVVELTEHSQVADYEPLNAVLAGIRRAGVRIAVDDAGAGFASGQHILRIRPDIIKLDRAIVTAIDTEPGQHALAAGLVAIAENIGALVTAEGIETLAELRCITTLGIRCGQGFLLGRPTVEAWKWQRWTAGGSFSPLDRSTPIPVTVSSSGGCDPAANRAAPDALAATGGLAATGRLVPGTNVVQPSTAEFALAVLDALPDATAVLDLAGMIVAVNRAWRLFAIEDRPEASGVGASYLDACARDATAGGPDAAAALCGLQAVLSGRSFDSEREYACGSPSGPRWFISRITSISGPTGGAVVSQVDITRRKRSEQELAHQASHDSLTGLANRILFTQTLAAALTPGPAQHRHADIGLLYIDLDRFKPINDVYGHAAGDKLLLLITERLRAHVRPQDTIARLGGDEFAVCAPRISVEGLASLADRLAIALAEPYQIYGAEVKVSASIGSHLAARGDNVAEALRITDRAMYAVKHARAQEIVMTP